LNLREPYAATALASLEWSEVRERAIDRVAAAGKCSRLGLDLWKARYLLEVKAYQDVSESLRLHYLNKYKAESQGIAERIVSECLHEFLGPVCLVCSGRRELVVGDLKITCAECDGSGLRRYSDIDRARHMQLSLQYVRLLSRKIGWLMGELFDLDRSVNVIMAEELERT
jgi:hypothetical protein